MPKIRLWMSAAFPVSFYHINALAHTKAYHIYVSHHLARMPYLQDDRQLSDSSVVRFYEPSFEADEDYVAWCLSYCQQNNIQLFIPGKSYELFAAKRAAFDAIGTQLMVAASSRTLTLLNNKIKFLEAISELNIPIAPWLSFCCRESFNRAWRKMGAGKTVDLCIKPAIGVYGSGFWRISRQKSYLHQYNRLIIDVETFRKRLGNKIRKPSLLMAYCEGSERSVDCVCYKGKLITALIRKKAKHSQVTEENPTLLNYASQLIAHFKLSGIINIQFKDFKGTPCILEINPRASAGSVMAYQANLNIMPLAVEAYLNKGTITQPICPKPAGQHIARTHLYYTIDTEHDHGDVDDTLLSR